MSDRTRIEQRLHDLLAACGSRAPSRIVVTPALHRELWLECTADRDPVYDAAVRIKYAGIPVEADLACPPDTMFADYHSQVVAPPSLPPAEPPMSDDARPSLACLTAAQRRVLETVAAGHDYDRTARLLDLSVWTVRNHMRQAADRIPADFHPNVECRSRLLMFYAVAASLAQLDAFAA